MDLQQASLDLVRQHFPQDIVGEGAHAGQRWIEVRRERIVDVLKRLRDELSFEMLTDLTCVDWLDQGKQERFCIVYVLYSVKHNGYFRLKAWVPEDEPEIDSAIGLWRSADWAEREVWDLFGVRFRGHPRMERLLLPASYTGHPLRKDYPLTGRGERYDFPKHER